MTETDATTKQILVWLVANGHPAWRTSAHPVPGRRLRTTSRGIGDIITCARPRGKHVEIEVKTGRDKPRPAQLAHAEAVRRAGGVYIFVSDLDDFASQFAALQREGII